MGFLTPLTNATSRLGRGRVIQVSKVLQQSAYDNSGDVLEHLNTSAKGLTYAEAEERIERYGLNEVAKEKKQTWYLRLWENIKNPLVILLTVLCIISLATQDFTGAVIIFFMIVLGIVLRYFQESRADEAAEKLKAMVSTTATVIREGKRTEIPLKELVPGDVVALSAGDMIPGDVRVLTYKDLFLTQSALTGEALPVEKNSLPVPTTIINALEMPNLCFMGTNVESGSGTAVVVHTGNQTYFGSLASSIAGRRVLTSFDKGVNSFTWLMIGFMAFMVPTVFIVNGVFKHDWLEAFMFALSVAVGLTPEMLPMIVSVNLSKGAIAMSHKKVIVKRLNSIQNFGAMDVLCTDKTGTITKGKIVLERYLDARGNASERVLEYGYINSYYQTGLKNLMDVAILEHRNLNDELQVDEIYHKIDELPFDFQRRRMSVIVEDNQNRHHLICKGAAEEVMRLCKYVDIDDQILEVTPEHHAKREALVRDLNTQGFRIIAVAYRDFPGDNDLPHYTVADESDMVLLGYLAFLDPPKETTAEAIARLHEHAVDVKVLTGDNDAVTACICKKVGLPVDHILLGDMIETMSDAQLGEQVETISVFAKLSPMHKERVIRALQARGHVVGFMGDGINDAPALKAADVGISVDTAVDIAKESSDIILLENSLNVLEEGVLEGRRVFGNIIKYTRMAASSNFGNMFSVLGASIFLPFLPMLPIQVLANNLLYDFSQTTIPSDNVDEEWIKKPRKWAINDIRRFIVFIGPISSIFDYTTFFFMLFALNCWNNPALFHTAWFVESCFTQTLIIHVIRTKKIPFVQSKPSKALLISSIVIVSVAAYLPFSPLAGYLGFVPLPPVFWLYLLAAMVCYVTLTQIVKNWYYRKFKE